MDYINKIKYFYLNNKNLYILVYFIIFFIFYYEYKIKINKFKQRRKLINDDLKDFKEYYNSKNESIILNDVINITIEALKYSEKLGLTNNEKNIVRKVSLLHECYNKKDEKDLPRLHRRIKNDLRKQGCFEYEVLIIEMIINDLSFFKEKKIRNERKMKDKKIISFSDERLQLIRDIVSDSIKNKLLEIDIIDKILKYSIDNNLIKNLKNSDKWYEEHIKNIRKYCNENIFILISDNYIRTDIGKKSALYKEKRLKKKINDDKYLYNKIKEY